MKGLNYFKVLRLKWAFAICAAASFSSPAYAKSSFLPPSFVAGLRTCASSVRLLASWPLRQARTLFEMTYDSVVLDGGKYARVYRTMSYENYKELQEGRYDGDVFWVRPEPLEYANAESVTVEFLVPMESTELWISKGVIGENAYVFHPTIRASFQYVIGMVPGSKLRPAVSAEFFERPGVESKLYEFFPPPVDRN